MPSGALFLAGRERAHEKPEPGESTQSGSPQPCVALECLKGHGALSAKYTLDFEDSKKKKKKRNMESLSTILKIIITCLHNILEILG